MNFVGIIEMPPTNSLMPLSPAAFRLALKKGQGRAAQQINDFGIRGLEQQLIEASTTCIAYDPQCEGMREEWLFSLLEYARLQDDVLRAIVEAEHQVSTNESSWDMEQRSAILGKMAASGSSEARQILYATLAAHSNDSLLRSASAIITLDGIDGLLRVARLAGQQLRDDPESWVDDYYIRCCNEPADAVEAVLQNEAAKDEDVARYLAGVSQTVTTRISSSIPSPWQDYSAQQILDHLKAKPADPCHWLRRWGRDAGEVERDQIFTALLLSNDAEQITRLFKCFTLITIPRFDDRLIKWATHPREQMQWVAVQALKLLKHPKIRAAAEFFIDNGKLAHGITLLVNNFQHGDFEMIAGRLAEVTDEDETHRVVGLIIDMYESNPGPEAKDCLLFVYESSPCSLCRAKAFKALVECRAAPDRIVAEATFDVDFDTRALASETSLSITASETAG